MATKKREKKTDGVKSTGNEVALFLHEGIVASPPTPELYSIGKEFVKIKKNRHVRVFVILLVFLAVLFSGTVFISAYIEERTSRTSIDISDFEDLNLAELVALARDAEKNMSKMSKDMEFIKARMSGEIEKAVAGSRREIQEIRLNSRLSEERKKELIRKIRSDQELKVAAVRSGYGEKISRSERKIAELQGSLNNYRAQSKERIEKYESRLNERLQSYEKQLADNRTKTSQIIKQQQTDYEKQLSLQRSGYDSEIRTLTEQREDLQRKIRAEQERSEAMNLYLVKYRNSLSVLAQRTGEHGHVIDASRPSSILVEMNPLFTIKSGDTGYVLDRNNRVLAMVELTPSDVGARARVVRRIKDDPIRPFDILLLRKK